MTATTNCLLIKDCIDAVWQDSYIWACIWSQPRRGKTTLAGVVLYGIYEDILHDSDAAWNAVLQSTIFNLEAMISRLKTGTPMKQWTLNGLHNRVPAINWDDFGAYSNKATTQHSEAWDDFKGGFDVLGTKVGVVLSTMVDPSEPTFQLNNKFTHEIQITSLGHYKYDVIKWQQDFRSNRIKIRKTCIETGTFDRWPDWVYKEYDKTRQSLADEVFQRIEDKISSGALEYTLKILKPQDAAVLSVLNDVGLASREVLTTALPVKIHQEYNVETMMRLKSRNLIIGCRQPSGRYKYDLTQLGRDVLAALETKQLKDVLQNSFTDPKKVQQNV
jgi:hypothetical protein